MAFQQIDDRATDPDEYVDAATLKDTFGNIQAAQQARVRSGVAVFGDVDSSNNVLRPRICVYNGRAVIPMLWHKVQGETEVRVSVRHKTPSNVTSGGTEMVIGVQALSLDQVLRTAVSLSPSATTNVSNSSTSVTTSLNVSTANLAPGWNLIMVYFGASGEGSWVDIEEGTGKPQNVVTANGWTYGGVWVDTSTDDYSATDVPCQAVRFINNGSGDADDRLPGPTQIIRVQALGTDYFLHTYPRIPVSSDDLADEHDEWYDPTLDYYQYQELGYIDLESIQIKTNAIRAIPDAGALLDGGRPASALAAIALTGASDQVWREHTRIHHMGPSNDPSLLDAAFTPSVPVNRLSHSVLNDATWRTIGQTLVAAEDGFTLEGTTYYRTRYETAALAMLSHIANDSGLGTRVFAVSFRIRMTDLDGSSNAVTGEEITLRIASARMPVGVRDPTGYDYALLAGWHLQLQRGTLSHHALRGVWPASAWSQMPPDSITPVLCNVLDTSTASERLLSLQVRGAVQSLEPTSFFYPKHIHLMTWTAISAPLGEITSAGGAT